MIPIRFPALLTLPLLVSLIPAVLSLPASGQSAPAQITTDTPQYCLQLFDRVSALVRVRTHPPQDVTELSSEGERMCNQGQTLGGIMRLRRALVLLEGERR
jgi:hypothetical protein